jgi:hypothetical protein
VSSRYVTDSSRIRRLVITNDGRYHQPEYECIRKSDLESGRGIDDGAGKVVEDDEDPEDVEVSGAGEDDEDGEGDKDHEHDKDDHEEETISQGSESSQQPQAQPLISFIDFIRPFPNVTNLWISFHPFREEDDWGYDGLQAAADECDRKRQDPIEETTLSFPKVTFLSLEVLGPAMLGDWAEEMDFQKLSQLKCTLQQLDLPNLRVWHLGLGEMWGFHSGDPADGISGHPDGEERGEDSWEVLRDALSYAQFPKLREFHLSIECEVIYPSFEVNLCVSTAFHHLP